MLKTNRHELQTRASRDAKTKEKLYIQLSYEINQDIMTIQRQGGEIIIRIADNIDIESLQRLINYLTYNELTSKSKATQKDIDELSTRVNKNWWEKNKDRFLNK